MRPSEKGAPCARFFFPDFFLGRKENDNTCCALSVIGLNQKYKRKTLSIASCKPSGSTVAKRAVLTVQTRQPASGTGGSQYVPIRPGPIRLHQVPPLQVPRLISGPGGSEKQRHVGKKNSFFLLVPKLMKRLSRGAA